MQANNTQKTSLLSYQQHANVVIPDDAWNDVPPEIKRYGAELLTEMQGEGILPGTKVKVCVVLDVSGSMSSNFSSGRVQILLNKALAMAKCLDDDGSIEIFPFATTCENIPIVADFSNFLNVIGPSNFYQLSHALGGGTNYSPAVRAVQQSYFTNQGNKATHPVYALFVTDGEPDAHDKPAMREAFRMSSFQPVFWKVIALGSPSDLPTLKALDKCPTYDNPKGYPKHLCNFIDNFDFKNYQDPSKLTAEDMLDELPQYLHESFQKGLYSLKPNLDEAYVTRPREKEEDEEEEISLNDPIASKQEEKRSCCNII